jgi:hypothetical protein
MLTGLDSMAHVVQSESDTSWFQKGKSALLHFAFIHTTLHTSEWLQNLVIVSQKWWRTDAEKFLGIKISKESTLNWHREMKSGW